MIRGGGVYQQAVDLCIEKLAIGDWVHIFPEGKVNMTKENLRFKWGIGRMIYESPVPPIIVPIWHEGMDTVLPNYPPYIFKFGKKITINVGQPINISDLVDSLKKNNTPEPVARKIITDRLQEEMDVSVRKRKIGTLCVCISCFSSIEPGISLSLDIARHDFKFINMLCSTSH